MDKISNINTRNLSSNEHSTEKKKFKLISWNIDGLYPQRETLPVRTLAIIDVIKREKPDAVFLQEVIPDSLALFNQHLHDYEYFSGNKTGYFVTIMTRRDTMKQQSCKLIPYPSTNMDRNLIIVHAVYENRIEMDLMTSHHESLKEGANERIRQLKICFDNIINAQNNRIVLFGGDLNMRDKELQQAGGIPNGWYDIWEKMGKNQEHAYTWDMQTNTNLNFPRDGFLPRCRFDRLYVRPAMSSTISFQPISFKLQGLAMIPSINRFCSDHWAIQAEFEV